MNKDWRKKLTTYIQDNTIDKKPWKINSCKRASNKEIMLDMIKEQNESHLSVGSWDDQLDVEEQTSLVEHQQQQEEDSR
jgi:hypothetical protein